MSEDLLQLLCQRRGLSYAAEQMRALQQFVIYMDRHSYWLNDILEQDGRRLFRFSDETSHIDLSEEQIWAFIQQLRQGKPLPWEQLILGTKQGHKYEE